MLPVRVSLWPEPITFSKPSRMSSRAWTLLTVPLVRLTITAAVEPA